MGLAEAKSHLKKFNKDQDIIELGLSSATVELAAKALGTEESRIAKTLSFGSADRTIVVVTAGNTKIDNQKFREEFGFKANLLSPAEVGQRIGHEIGGVCPFGVKNGVEVYLDVSMRQYNFVYPACGSHNSAIKLTCEELQEISQAVKWVDVCKEKPAVITIVPAQAAHVQECLPILADSVLGSYFDPALAQTILAEGQGKQELFVAVMAGSVVGFYQMAKTGAFLVFPYLHLLAVKTSQRGTGIGGSLLQHFEALNLAAEGYPSRPKVFLLVSAENTGAVKFYERNGYHRTAQFDDMFGDGDTEYLMMKDLGHKQHPR